jgi:hypothetical protein
MTKPVTPHDMFDLWQKMVNPGAYPLQSLMFPVLDAKELEKKIAELETVEHWLKANLNMLQLTIKSLDYQRQMVKGGERVRAAMEDGKAASEVDEEVPNPAMWAWNMMTQAGTDAAEAMGRAAEAAGDAAAEAESDKARAAAGPKPRARKKKS